MRYTIRVALTVALGGFLMGFDASVISGVVAFIEPEFELSKIELGWAVASLTLTATLAMMLAGPLSDRLGRRPVLKIAAVLFAHLGDGLGGRAQLHRPWSLARMLGGFGVGAALIIAPMYIAEIAPAAMRGRMVSFNQLNIVIGISAAFFTNYLILRLGQSDLAWAQSASASASGTGAGCWASRRCRRFSISLRFCSRCRRALVGWSCTARTRKRARVLEQVSGARQAEASSRP